MAAALRFPEPPLDWPTRLADALARARALDREILWRLVGHVHTYGELRPLLGKRTDNNLTQALARLRRDGLIRTRTDTATRPPTDYYEPTELGVAVFVTLVQRDAIHRFTDAVQRGLSSPLTA